MPTALNHWINGQLSAGTSGRTSPVYNPGTGEQTGALDLASKAEVDAAVELAAVAAQKWRSSSLSTRAHVLFTFRALLHDRSDDLAAIITAEHGKVLGDAAGEIARGLENVEFACGVPQMLKGAASRNRRRPVWTCTRSASRSVSSPASPPSTSRPWCRSGCAPTRSPAAMRSCSSRREKDPSAALFIAQLWKDAGLPDGVFTVINGDKEAVDALLENPTVKAVSFVGSTPIARYIYATGTANGKRVQALGGAKNHMLVLPDADVNMAADAAVSAAYGSAGERCMAISVAVAVGDASAIKLIDAISERLPKLRIGVGTDPESEMGPLITREHRDKVAAYIGAGEAAGATVVVDGRSADLPADGFFLGVTLLDNVSTSMSVYTDEIFGPVLAVVRADTYAEALQMVNDNEFGNGTAIFTRDGGAARQFQFEVEAGMVGVNVPIPVPVGYYSFGGWKASLFGDTHMYGPEGVNFYTRGKVVTSRWPDPSTSTVDLGFPRTR